MGIVVLVGTIICITILVGIIISLIVTIISDFVYREIN